MWHMRRGLFLDKSGDKGEASPFPIQFYLDKRFWLVYLLVTNILIHTLLEMVRFYRGS